MSRVRPGASDLRAQRRAVTVKRLNSCANMRRGVVLVRRYQSPPRPLQLPRTLLAGPAEECAGNPAN